MRNEILIERPSVISATLGGAAGAIVAGAVYHLAPAAGAPAVEVLRLLGGLLTASPETALWLGWLVHLVNGWLVVPVLLVALWETLPGDTVSVPGALTRGALAGLAVTAAVGLLLPVVAALSRVEAGAAAGLFALDAGAGGALVLLSAGLAYGLVLGAVASLSGGMAPLHALGWEDHSAGRSA